MAQVKVNIARRQYGVGKIWGAPLGTYTSTYAPEATNGKFDLGTTAATEVPGNVAALPVGITTEGMTFTRSIETEEDEAAEQYAPINVLVTGESAGLAFEMKTLNLTNLYFLFNAPPNQGADPDDTTAVDVVVPTPGDEVKHQWLWCSQDDSMLILLYSALNTGELSLSATKGAGGMNGAVDLQGTMPDASIAPTLFKIRVAGAKWAETVATD
ncbi:hypothetical protein ACIBSW_34585 [Actinoplanes sp. NPDC049668]|uniref:hypothetical protein n=1 Tax=unclassified Actinoplanes TaxID=2626549 RepID=UPI0033A00A31